MEELQKSKKIQSRLIDQTTKHNKMVIHHAKSSPKSRNVEELAEDREFQYKLDTLLSQSSLAYYPTDRSESFNYPGSGRTTSVTAYFLAMTSSAVTSWNEPHRGFTLKWGGREINVFPLLSKV